MATRIDLGNVIGPQGLKGDKGDKGDKGSDGNPIGTILSYIGSTAPTGYLLCNGATYDTTTYSELYELLGTNVLPDLRGRFLQGANGNLGTNVEAGLPNITGVLGASESSVKSSGAFYAIAGGDCPTSAYVTRATKYFDASKGETKTDGTLKTDDELHVYGNSDTVQPPAYTVNYIIKAT